MSKQVDSIPDNNGTIYLKRGVDGVYTIPNQGDK